MNIVHYLDRLDMRAGGTYRAIVDMCTLLAESGHRVTLMTRYPRDIPLGWRNTSAIRTKAVGRNLMPVMGPAALRSCYGTLRQADILHLHSVWQPVDAQLGYLATVLRLPYVVTVHGVLDDWSMSQKRVRKTVYHRYVAHRLLGDAKRIQCTATAERDQATRWLANTPSDVIPYPFDVKVFRDLPPATVAVDALGLDTTRPAILFLSRLHYKKRPEVAIDMAGELKRRSRHFQLILAGDGDHDYVSSLKQRVERSGLNDCVRFVGLVAGDIKLSLYRFSRAFVLPTSQENFGLVLTEALACGTPVASTTGSDIWRDIEASGGAVIAAANAAAFADAVEPFLSSAAKAAAMGSAGREWVFNVFGGSTIVTQLENMYQAALAPGA